MTWKKFPADTQDIDKLYQQFTLRVKNGDSNIENMRVVFRYKDNPCIYIYTVFDFIDHYTTIKQNTIEQIFIYQSLDEVK